MSIKDLFSRSIKNPEVSPSRTAVESPPPADPEEVKHRIDETVKRNDVVLFMKGTPDDPMCGFSAAVVDMLRRQNAVFTGVDAIADPGFRYILSDYSNWPTLPQLFVKGKLVGGCDIVREMDERGELKELFADLETAR